MRPLRVSKTKSPTKVQQTPPNRLTENSLHQKNSVMSNIKFSFFLKSRKNKLNQHPIVLSITMDKDRTQVFTGVWVEKKKWNEKTKRIRGNDEDTQTLNDTLVSLLTQSRQISNGLLLSGEPFNPNTIKDKLKNGFSENKGVVESFELFLDRMKNMIPSKYSRPTWIKYTNTKERVKEFIKFKTKRNDIYLYELNTQFMEEFDLWVRKTYKVEHNTMYKTYQRFSRFLRFEMSRGNLKKYPFPDYEIKQEQKQGNYLNYEEIQMLENYVPNNDRHLRVQHLFIFCIYTGLSFIDLEQLKVTDMSTDENGMIWIKSHRQKSRSRISVPLISSALKSLEILRSGKIPILEGRLLPVPTNVRLNAEIKQLCGLVGISNSSKITWHTGRRSTSSLMIKSGIPLQVLQKVLSHKSISTSLMYYTHVDDMMVSEQMKEMEKRLDEIKNRGSNKTQ
jgi:integrase